MDRSGAGWRVLQRLLRLLHLLMRGGSAQPSRRRHPRCGNGVVRVAAVRVICRQGRADASNATVKHRCDLSSGSAHSSAVPGMPRHPQGHSPREPARGATGTSAARSAGCLKLTVVAPVAVLAGRGTLVSVVQHQRLPAKAAIPPPPMLVRVTGRRREGTCSIDGKGRNSSEHAQSLWCLVCVSHKYTAAPSAGVQLCSVAVCCRTHTMAALHAQTGPKFLIGSPQRPLNVPNAANLSIPAKVPAAGGIAEEKTDFLSVC